MGHGRSRMVAWTYLSLGYPHRELALGRPRPRVPLPTPQREGWHCGFLYRSWQRRRSLVSVPMSVPNVGAVCIGLVWGWYLAPQIDSRPPSRNDTAVVVSCEARYRRARNSMCSSSTAVLSMSEALALRGACRQPQSAFSNEPEAAGATKGRL